MDGPSDRLPPVAAAMQWVGRITSVALEMVLPGLGGLWLDQRLGTQYWVLLGFAFGLTAGVWHLVSMAGTGLPRSPKSTQRTNPRRESDERPE